MARAALHPDARAPDSGASPGSPQARRSLQLLWWIPLRPIVGFLLGSLMLSEAWPLWQVIPLALVLAAPFIVHFVAVPADDPAAARLLARSA